MKLIKKDNNEELEKILEEKKVEEQAKNLLQGMLYKIEVSYSDYQKAKVIEQTEEQYVEEILKNIKNKTNEIKTINLSAKIEDKQIREELKKNKFYIENNNITSYPIEEKLLYAIEKNANNKKIVNNRYGIITMPISNLINTGKSIDRVEVLRDFNGWSWTTARKEIENINANLVYQILRLLINEEFIDSWTKDTDGIIDYIAIAREELTKRYGDKLAEIIMNQISKIAISNETKQNEEFSECILKKLEEAEGQFKEYENTENKIVEISEKKKRIIKELGKIERILKNEEKLKQEYAKRNKDVPLEKKIFSVRVLKQELEKEKMKLKNKIEECDFILNPKNYGDEKLNIEKQKELAEVVNYNQEQLEGLKIDFLKSFLECFKIKLKKDEDIKKLIYQFRYFMQLTITQEKSVKNIEEIKLEIDKIQKDIMKKSVEKKVINKIPQEIIKYILQSRIIELERIYYKIEQKYDKMYVQIFDGDIAEEKFEIEHVEKNKINRKLKIFI